MTELKRLMKEFEAAEEKSNRLDDLWEDDYDNEDLEQEWMKAYKEEWIARERLQAAIVSFTHGMIDAKTVGTIILAKRDELKSLIERLA